MSLRSTWRRRRDDGGDTLLEVLLAVVLLGLAVAGVLTAFGASITMSTVHKNLSTTAADARNFADAVSRAVDDKLIAYAPCATPATYSSPSGFTPFMGDSVSVDGVEHWDGSAWQSACTSDKGVQRLTVRVSNTDTRAESRLQVVVRKPCLLSDVTAGPCS